MTKQCGYVTLIGAPNVGKSTLLNCLVGGKVSIVSPKVQTTRFIVNGIVVYGESQIIFVDTPGLFTPKDKRPLEQAIVKQAKMGLSEARIIALLIDAKQGLDDDTKAIINKLQQSQKKAVILINKIDLIEKSKLLALAQQMNETGSAEEIFMISAKKGDGIEDITKYFANAMPQSAWLYPEDQMSDIPIKLLSSEITREKLFYALQKELPYQLMVETESFKEHKKMIKIHQVIYVTSENHKAIILGKRGEMIKQVGSKSRMELQAILGQKVHLQLFVKVRKNWMDKELIMTHLQH